MQQEPRIPSNRMPPTLPSRPTPIGWIVLSAIGIGAIYLCIWEPMIIVVIVFFAAFACVLSLFESRRERRIASARQAASICTFARQFNCRTTDTWIIRAVFEELAHYVRFPIRALDRLEADLRIDSDDIPEIAEAVA